MENQENAQEMMQPMEDSHVLETNTDVENATQEEQIAEEQTKEQQDVLEESSDNNPSEKHTYKTKQEILDRIKEIAKAEAAPAKDEVERLKSLFYKLHSAERDAQQREYLEAGGDPASYQVFPDKVEEAFKAEMIIIKERRAKLFQEHEKDKQANLKRKLEIIEKIKEMSSSPEVANNSYQEFKALQQEWKDIKNVPAENASELWRTYHLYVEQFYDQLKLNNEAREYDFKKNLEIKTRLCEAAEKLSNEPDVVSAFHQLQELHQQYRETGPVAKDLREQIWHRFKEASTIINKRHQQHFESLRAQEASNLERKTALCDAIETIISETCKTVSEWEKRTKEIIALQAEWKTIGFAPQKMNVKIFERFRAACDKFFESKADFFKQLKQQIADSTKKKEELIAQARSLMDSTEWKATSDKLIALQKEWKTAGTVPGKAGEKLWNEFLETCNHFFEARNAAGAGGKGVEQRMNLDKKLNIIEQLKALKEEQVENIHDRIQALIEEYNAIGHVPYKEKDKVYNAFHEVLDELRKQFGYTARKRKQDNRNHAEDASSRPLRRYEQLLRDIKTYENNIGFLSSGSKKGNSLVEKMRETLDKLKAEAAQIKEDMQNADNEAGEEA